MTVSVVSIFMSMMIPAGIAFLDKVKGNTVMEDLAIIAEEIIKYEDYYNDYPDSLSEIPGLTVYQLDPWGNPYQYLKIKNGLPSANGKARKNKSLKKINTQFDLYSMGPDGESAAPLTASISKDDVIYANDGKFIGYVDDYN